MNDRPPPLPPRPKPPQTFYHHAATCCLLSPFVACGASIVIMAGTGPQRSRMDALVVAVLLGFIMLGGIALGIISLFGISKHGRAGILWKAVTGLLIFLFFFLAATPAFLHAKRIARQRYEQQYGHPPP